MINNITKNSALVPLCEASHKGTWRLAWEVVKRWLACHLTGVQPQLSF